jgi:hypothetical protein
MLKNMKYTRMILWKCPKGDGKHFVFCSIVKIIEHRAAGMPHLDHCPMKLLGLLFCQGLETM